ncbi:MAG: hypothetical protein H6754_06215 [Candidatus Omnitrophica bacterium]|nr:hypothetical protein [Candidatus Omnitrophota bacterium]
MRKTIVKLSILTICTFLLISAKAHALNYETAYMVRDNNSRILSLDAAGDYSYNAGETPWVYIKFQLADLAIDSPLHMLWVWSSNDDPDITESKVQSFSLSSLNTDKELWSSAPQPWWNNNGGPGQWHVDVNWFNVHGTNGISSANFTSCPSGGIAGRVAPCGPVGPVVTPEPLSTTLFLLGGVPLLAAIRKKQKTV